MKPREGEKRAIYPSLIGGDEGSRFILATSFLSRGNLGTWGQMGTVYFKNFIWNNLSFAIDPQL